MTPKEFVKYIDGLTHNKSDLHSEDIREIRKKIGEIVNDDPWQAIPYIPVEYPPATQPYYPDVTFGTLQPNDQPASGDNEGLQPPIL